MSYPIKVEFNVPATMRDGTILRANIFRPDAKDNFPVALTRTPYGKDLSTSNSYLDAVRLAREGYIVIIQDVRGRFNSEGEWYPMRNEAQDGFDTVEWAGQLPGSNGSVGMFGASYSGFTQWAAAMEAPPHLKAIVPAITWADARDGVLFRGGALELGVNAYWLLSILSFDTILKRIKDKPLMEKAMTVGALVNEINRLQIEGYQSLPLVTFEPLAKFDFGYDLFKAIAQPNNREAAKPSSVAEFYDRIRVPAFNVGGWYDLFEQGTLQNFTSLRTTGNTPEARQARLLMGPWSHLQQSHVIGEQDFGFAAQQQFINVQTDLTTLTQHWFDYWLKGVQNDMLQEPPVKLFIMGDNVWRDEAEWPLARTQYTNWYLHQDRGVSREPAQDEPADHYAYDPNNPTPTSGGAFLMNPIFNSGVKDQRPVEARSDVLQFTSDLLKSDLEVTGPITVKLWAASDAPDTDFVARLVDVHLDGFAQNLTDGVIRARYRNGDTPELLEPGKPYEFTIDLWSTANVFKAGHRIRVDVASASFPRWDRNLNTGAPFGTDTTPRIAHQTIFHDEAHPSHIVLPIIPGIST